MCDVEVLLPTHRRPHTIACSIRAILAQTFRDFRLHVIGDGCAAGTESIVRGFQDSRVHFHPFPKGTGLGYSHRNRVLRDTSGRYIAYATDDDLWFPDHLERAVAALEDGGLALVAFRWCPVRRSGGVDPHFFAFDWRAGAASTFLRNWLLGSPTVVHRRSVFARVGYWDDTLARFGDREFFKRVRDAGLPYRYVDDVTALRFLAREWDAQYLQAGEPPQAEYLIWTQDSQWRARMRRAAAQGPRSWAVRRRQVQDVLSFGLRSGPAFLRFWRQTIGGASPIERRGAAVNVK